MSCRYRSLEHLRSQCRGGHARVDASLGLEPHVFSLRKSQKNCSKSTTRFLHQILGASLFSGMAKRISPETTKGEESSSNQNPNVVLKIYFVSCSKMLCFLISAEESVSWL